MLEWTLIFVLLAFLLVLFVVHLRLRVEHSRLGADWARLHGQVEARAKELFAEWREAEEERIRRDAVARSASAILGRVGEQLAPLVILSNYGVSPKDLRFLGTPIDYVAFKGLSSGEPEEILFVEVKSGKGTALTPRERRIKELVESGRVRWLLIHVPTELERVKEALARDVG